MHKLVFFAKVLLISNLLLSPHAVMGDAKMLSWQDLLPPFDDSLDLDDGLNWGERVRTDLTEEDVRIPGFMVPLEYKETEVVTRFLLVPYFGAITSLHRRRTKPSMRFMSLGMRWGKFGSRYGLRAEYPPVEWRKIWQPHHIQ